MSTNETAPNEAGTFRCEVCGREFSRKQGLGRHMSETHGRPTTRAAKAKRAAAKRIRRETSRPAGETPVLAVAESGTVREQLRQMAAPLSEQRAEIDRRLMALAREAQQLRADRLDIDVILKRLDPSLKPQTSPSRAKSMSDSNKARGERQRAERVKALREHFARHADELREGFTSNHLIEMLRANGGMPMSSVTLRAALEELRDAGIVRADRVTRGGGMRYQLVTTGDESNG